MNKNKYFNPHYNQRDYDLGNLKEYGLLYDYMEKEESRYTSAKAEDILDLYSRNERLENTDRNRTIRKYSHWGIKDSSKEGDLYTVPEDILSILIEYNNLIHTLITATDTICFIQDEFIVNKDFKEKKIKDKIKYEIAVVRSYLEVSECNSMVAPTIIKNIFHIEPKEMSDDDFEGVKTSIIFAHTIPLLKVSINILKDKLDRSRIAIGKVRSEWTISYTHGSVHGTILKEKERCKDINDIVNIFRLDTFTDNLSELNARINSCISFIDSVSNILEEGE